MTFFVIWILISTWTAKIRIPIWPYHALLQCFQGPVNYDEGYTRRDIHPGYTGIRGQQRTNDEYDDGGFNRQRFLQKSLQGTNGQGIN